MPILMIALTLTYFNFDQYTIIFLFASVTYTLQYAPLVGHDATLVETNTSSRFMSTEMSAEENKLAGANIELCRLARKLLRARAFTIFS